MDILVKVELSDNVSQKLWLDLMSLYESRVRRKVRLNLRESIQRETNYSNIIRTKIGRDLSIIDSERFDD